MRPFARILLLVSTLASAGCGRFYDIGHAENPRNGTFAFVDIRRTPPYTAGLVFTEAPAPPKPVYVSNVYYVNGAGPAPLPPRSRRDVVEESDADLPSFDPQAARAALTRVDVAGCREAGAPVGWGHAKVTFSPDGTASKVVIDEPSGLSPSAVQCLGSRVGAVKLTRFKGSLVTMGTTFHVR
jgi:hypothetical protein